MTAAEVPLPWPPRDRTTPVPAPKDAASIVAAVEERGVPLSTDGQDVVEIEPPLVCAESDVRLQLDNLGEVLGARC